MSYLEFVIPEHVLWIQVLQLSHWMAGHLLVTALLQTPQGWAGAGPGLDETSLQRMIRTSWIV